jgi:Cu+-exporting ATPase
MRRTKSRVRIRLKLRGKRSNLWEGERFAEEEALMERDVVCGMQVDPATAAGKSEYNGKTFYFCSPICKKKFDANPGQYAGK